MRFVPTVLAALLVTSVATSARANFFTFATQDNTSLFSADPGTTVDVQIFLVETFDPGTETSRLEDDNGLFSAGFRIDRVGPGPSEPAAVLDVTDITANPAFDDTVSQVIALTSTGGAEVVENVDIFVNPQPTVGVLPTTVNAQTRSILLGTITMTAGNTTIEQTDFIIQDNDPTPTTEDTVTFDLFTGGALDDQIQAFNFGVIVPTPGTAWVALAFAVMLRRRR